MAKALTAMSGDTSMIDLAHKISAETLADMCVVMDGKEEATRGPIVLMRDITNDLGDGMAIFPPIDSEVPEADKDKPLTNQNVNGYWIARPMAKGGTRKVRAWRTWDFADNTTANVVIDVKKCLTGEPDRPTVVGGREIQQAKVDLTALISNELTKGSDKKRYDQERTYWNGRETTNRNTYEKAIAIWQRINLIRTVCDKLSVTVLVDGKTAFEDGGLPTLARKAFLIQEKARPDQYVQWSISTFLGCDPELAQQDGGTIDDLTATVGGEPDEGDEDQVAPMKLSDLEREAGRFQRLLDENNIAHIVKGMANKKDTGHILGHTLVALSMTLDKLVIDAELTDKYERVEKELHAESVARAVAQRKTA